MKLKMTPLITIGIPFYNAEKFLSQAILSVLNQTYQDWELILLDDGSSDSSLKIAQKYAEKDSRIKVLSDGTNKKTAYRLNQLAELGQGIYSARLDADDIMRHDRLEKQVSFMQANPQTDIVGSGYYGIDEKNNILGRFNPNMKMDSITELYKNHVFVQPSIMAKTEWFKKNKYNLAMVRMEDWELWTRTVHYSVFANINEPLIFYRTEATNTYKKYIKTNQNIIKLLTSGTVDIPQRLRVKQIISFSIKIAVYTVFELFQSTEFLVKKRLTGMSTQEKEMALSYLKEALYEK